MTSFHRSRLFLLVICFYSQAGICQTGKITGHLIADNKADRKRIIENTIVILGSDNKITYLNEDLDFSFDSLNAGTTQLRIEGLFFFPDTNINDLIVQDGKTIHLEIPWPIVCEFDKSKKDKTCPVCKKKDESIPIAYGLLVDTGKKTRKKEKEFYTGGCVISGCDPNWYCKRDKIKF